MSSDWLTHHHSHAQSPLHRLPAAWKLVAALVIIGGTMAIPLQWVGWYVGVTVVLGIFVIVSGIPLWFLVKRFLLLSPFILGVALVNALEADSRDRWMAVAVKGVLCLLTVILVSNTTPFSKILRVLRILRVPALLITTLALMHRYLFVLADETERMRRARLSRTFRTDRRFHWRTLATVLGQLFIRASERAERIYDAMCARGWK